MPVENYNEIIVCLFDGDYHLGVAALINSLSLSKFKGLINVGYREIIPQWVEQLEATGDNYFKLNNDITIHFDPVTTDMHLGYYKPYFLKETIDKYKTTSKFYYFDVDIIVCSPWNVYSNWLDKGICLCLDNAFHFLHTSHPWRKDWRRVDTSPEKQVNDTHYYFNSGFLGIERESIALIDKWIFFTEIYIKMGGDIKRFVKDAYSSFKGDQDLLNAAITTTNHIEISIMGKEAMGFTFPATLMFHAIGDIKPWNKNFFKYLVHSGNKPTIAEQAYLSYSDYPIRVFSPTNYKLKKLNIKMASLFGRFLG